MRLRNIPRADEVIRNSTYVVHHPEKQKGKWREAFQNDHPVHLEIGTGKGRFLLEQAQQHAGINYIGIEKYSSVLLRAVERQDQLALQNLLFIRGEAELITEYFHAEEIAVIYLNFPDPWPKKRNAARRLPSRDFLRRYDQILEENGIVEFKTDNRELFDYAVEEVTFSRFEMVGITYDLHQDSSMNEGNILTEYEMRFSEKGAKICKYILKKACRS